MKIDEEWEKLCYFLNPINRFLRSDDDFFFLCYTWAILFFYMELSTRTWINERVGTQSISFFLSFFLSMRFSSSWKSTGCKWHRGVVNVVVLKQKEKDIKVIVMVDDKLVIPCCFFPLWRTHDERFSSLRKRLTKVIRLRLITNEINFQVWKEKS